jgi:hypothetical protein
MHGLLFFVTSKAAELLLMLYAVQEPGAAAQIRGAARAGKDFGEDVRGVESRDWRKETAGARQAEAIDQAEEAVGMARTSESFDVVRELGRALTGVEEGTMYGAPALKLGGKMLACMATNKAADPDSLVVQVGFVNRDLLIAKDPSVYYVRTHYVPYPAVVVRLNRIKRSDLQELLEMAHRFLSSEKRRAAKPARRRVQG